MVAITVGLWLFLVFTGSTPVAGGGPSAPVPQATPTPSAQPVAISDLSVTPRETKAGVPVTVAFAVNNTGSVAVDYSIDVLVDAVKEATASGKLPPGGSRFHRVPVVRQGVGGHTVAVQGQLVSFLVPAPRMEVSDLQIWPRAVGVGDPVQVSAVVTNVGGAPGPYTVALYVGGSPQEVASGLLPAGESAPLVFSVNKDQPGLYAVELGGQTDGFQALAPLVKAELERNATINATAAQALDAGGKALSLVGDRVLFRKASSETLVVDLPVVLPQGSVLSLFHDPGSGIRFEGNLLEIPIRDAQRQTLVLLKAEVEAPLGTSQGASANVRRLRLQVPQREVDLSLARAGAGRVSVFLEGELNPAPPAGTLEVVAKADLPQLLRGELGLLARKREATVADVGFVLEGKQGLLSGVFRALTVRVAPGLEWVQGQGGPQRIQVIRVTPDNALEFLPARFLGNDSQGRPLMETTVSEGFAFLALVALAPAEGISSPVVARDLSITPSAVAPGEPVEVSATVANRRTTPAVFQAVLLLDEVPFAVKAVRLNPGEERNVKFRFALSKAGSYRVKLEGLAGRLDVAAPLPPGVVQLADLQISPAQPAPGQQVTISAVASNTGGQSGIVHVEVLVNRVLAKVLSLALEPGTQQRLSFVIHFTAPGSYQVSLGNLQREVTVAAVERPSSFVLSGLGVTPSEVKPGEPVTIRFEVLNAGDVAGTFQGQVRINESLLPVDPLALETLTRVPVTLRVTRDAPGVYQVRVGSLEGAFRVKEVLAPIFRVEDLSIQPPIVRSGRPVTIGVKVSNLGMAAGSHRLTVRINGVVAETVDIGVAPTGTREVSVAVKRRDPGTYRVQVDTLEGSFTVERQLVSARMLVGLALGALLLVAIGAVVYSRWHRHGRPQEGG